MEFRFLFVDDRGEKVYVPSLEALTEHVRSGALREEALLYDARTREWAPARTHPAFRAPSEEDRPLRRTPRAPEATATPGPAAALPELAPLPEEESGIDPVQAFFEDRERERLEEARDQEGDLERSPFLAPDVKSLALESAGWGDAPPQPGDPGYTSFRATDSGTHALDATGEAGTPGPDSGSGPSDAPTGTEGSGDTARALLAGAAAGVRRRRGTTPKRGGSSSGVVRWVRRTRARSQQRSREAGPRQAALLAVLVVVGGWGIADAWGVSALEATDLRDHLAEAASRASGPLAPSMEAAKSGAFDDMVRGMETLRATMRVDEPPESWMGGPYLANALAYPEVESFWTRYLDYVEALATREEELFRSGFVSRLQAQGISGPVLSIRLARALRDFRADRARRNQTYGAMEELADAALDLHAFLADNAESIRYAPVDQGVTDDPILEAVADEEATRDELWSRLERLADALDRVAGEDPSQRRNVSRRVLADLAMPDVAGS